ncbi:glycan-binding surface protein [Pontibacter sp. E15-1]|uniref:glycan-binding surface protein n=1 Tax=Pontibacter sp. E15-1 TaxID=2919918 RepID=UPI001F4FDDE5|nr:glycan-binding surface protein [Pontibacter sp. E15-1]MCJ8165877.1 glycan-binding surface protein [Pontibacter sp. E15-1]
MKRRYNSWLFLFLAFAMAGIFSGCSEDDVLPNGGKPMVSYVRVTRPAASDSLVVKAGQGSMVAIIGENLQNARKLWFNDQPAQLIPTFITNTTIITRVPSNIPTSITNTMKIVFANGDSLLHDFTVDISEPVITGMLSEYVNTGDVATIMGSYFYEPVTVTFTGGVEGAVVSVEDGIIEVTVPEGAMPGPITVKTNFGETESDFWFRDNRNIIASFDGTTAGFWSGADYVKASDPEITAINGKFLRFNKNLGQYPYSEFWVAPTDVAMETVKIPQAAFAKPSAYVLKFEIATLAPLAGAEMRMYMGNNMAAERNDVYYNWKPNVDTGGSWETVTIPFEVFYTDNNEFPYNPAGYGVSFYFHGPMAVNTNFAMDNMRVVPKTAK